VCSPRVDASGGVRSKRGTHEGEGADCRPDPLFTTPLHREDGDNLPAGVLAAPAYLCADPAVLMVVRVPLALLGAGPAGLGARLNERARGLRIELGHSADDSARRSADVTAVLTQADTAEQRCDVVLTEACVRAGDTALRAIETSLDAGNESACLYRDLPRMRLEQLLCVRHRVS
jgi:hypothetical protein